MKKRSMSIIVPIFIMLVVSATCVGTYYFFYNRIARSKRVETKENLTITMSSENYPRVMTIPELENLTNSLYTNFTENEINNTVSVEFDKAEILNKLISREIDVAIVPSLSGNELASLQSNGAKLERVTAVKDALVFITNSSNTVNNLSKENIEKIYSGEIKNWNEVKGQDMEIKVYQKPSDSFVQKVLENAFKNTGVKEKSKVNIIKSDEAIANINSEYYSEEGRIGITLFNNYKIMYNDVSEGVINSDKLISIDNIMPGADTISNNTYPYLISYDIVYRSDETQDSNVRKWVDNVMSEYGKNIIKEAGFIAN